MNREPYARKFSAQPPRPSEADSPKAPRRRKKRRSIGAVLLMLVGAGTLFVLLMRYVIVPVLVMLPGWMGGGA